eukprot:243096_1
MQNSYNNVNHATQSANFQNANNLNHNHNHCTNCILMQQQQNILLNTIRQQQLLIQQLLAQTQAAQVQANVNPILHQMSGRAQPVPVNPIFNLLQQHGLHGSQN